MNVGLKDYRASAALLCKRMSLLDVRDPLELQGLAHHRSTTWALRTPLFIAKNAT
jgi:hypothetical protein